MRRQWKSSSPTLSLYISIFYNINFFKYHPFNRLLLYFKENYYTRTTSRIVRLQPPQNWHSQPKGLLLRLFFMIEDGSGTWLLCCIHNTRWIVVYQKKKTKVKYFNINKSRHFLRYARLYHHHFGILWMPETLNNLEKEKKNSPLNKSIILSPFVSQIYSIDYIFVDKKKI